MRFHAPVVLVLAGLIAALLFIPRDDDREARLTKLYFSSQNPRPEDAEFLYAEFHNHSRSGIDRELALIALGKLQDPRVLPEMLRELPVAIAEEEQRDRCESTDVRAVMMQDALASYGPETIKSVVRFSQGTVREKRWFLSFLRYFQDLRLTGPYYAELLNDPDPFIRFCALGNLEQHHSKDAVPYILPHLEDTAVAGYAWSALLYSTYGDAHPLLVERFGTREQQVLHDEVGKLRRLIDLDALAKRSLRN